MHADRMHTEYYSWRSCEGGAGNVQIDLIIEQADGITDICEAKYSGREYVLDKKEYNKLLKRKDSFEEATMDDRTTRVVLITTKGLKKGVYSDIFQNIVLLKDLFE